LDNIAKKMTSEEAMLAGIEWKRNAIPYMAASNSFVEPLYIHRNSSVYNSDASLLPVFVAYTELTKTSTGRTCMKGVTAVDPKWLPHLSAGTRVIKFSDPVSQPGPSFDRKSDTVVCFAVPKFGPKEWELSVHQIPYPAGPERIRWFARLLLEGAVLPSFMHLKPHLNANPAQLTKSKVMQQKFDSLLQPLYKDHIDSKEKLLLKWKSNPTFIQREITAWLQPSSRSLLAQHWKAIIRGDDLAAKMAPSKPVRMEVEDEDESEEDD
jgi:ATP-dependent RNA helicase DHX37/DHR1